MRLIEINTLSNGAHRNQTSEVVEIPTGWAVIPEGMETPNFPFGSVVAEDIDGAMTVTSWEPGAIPEPEHEPTPEPTIVDISLDLLAGHEERICLLELTSAT